VVRDTMAFFIVGTGTIIVIPVRVSLMRNIREFAELSGEL